MGDEPASLEVGDELPPSGHGRAKGLLSSPASGSRIDAKTFAPPAGLADVIECFWMGRWSLPQDAPHTTELLGDPCVHVVFERSVSRVVGVWTKRWVRTLAGDGFVRAAKLRAGAVAAWFSTSAHLISDALHPLPALFGDGCQGVEPAVLDPQADEDGLRALAEFLERTRREPDPQTQLAIEAAASLDLDRHPTVEGWAAAHGMTPRTMQRLFRRHVGASPKFLLRRRRLQEAALRIERGDAENLAHLAAELGYTDQAHLARDMRAAAGLSPSKLRDRLNEG